MPGYTPPVGNAVSLNFTGAYTPPLGAAVFINFTNPLIMTMDPGSYVIAGTDLGIKAGRVLRGYNNLIINGEFPLDTSSWSVDGADTVFASANGQGVLTLGPAASGGFAWQAVTVVPGRTYTISAFLQPHAYVLSAAPGSYNLTGSDATLTYTPVSAAIADHNITQSGAGAQGVGYTIKHDGTVADGTGATIETWLPTGAGSASGYDVRATLQSGVMGSGFFGTWLNLASDQNWSLVESSIGTLTCTILLELAHAGTGVAIDTATITLTVTRTS